MVFKCGQTDVTNSIGNLVNNIVMTVCGARWILDLLGDHFVRHINV